MRRRSICAILCAAVKGSCSVFPQPFIKGCDGISFRVSHWQQGGIFPDNFLDPRVVQLRKGVGYSVTTPLFSHFYPSVLPEGWGGLQRGRSVPGQGALMLSQIPGCAAHMDRGSSHRGQNLGAAQKAQIILHKQFNPCIHLSNSPDKTLSSV